MSNYNRFFSALAFFSNPHPCRGQPFIYRLNVPYNNKQWYQSNIICTVQSYCTGQLCCCVCVRQKAHVKDGAERPLKEVGGVVATPIALSSSSVAQITTPTVMQKVSPVQQSQRVCVCCFLHVNRFSFTVSYSVVSYLLSWLSGHTSLVSSFDIQRPFDTWPANTVTVIWLHGCKKIQPSPEISTCAWMVKWEESQD